MIGDDEVQITEAVGASETSKENLPEKPIEDPKLYFQLFRESDLYKTAFAERMTKIQPSMDVTDEEIREAAEETDDIKFAFLDFAKKTPFHYNPNFFPKSCLSAIADYEQAVRDDRDNIYSIGGPLDENQAKKIAMDQERMRVHDSAAFLLWDSKIAPSRRLGKALVSLIMIEKKLATFGGTAQSDADRARNLLLSRS